MIQTHNILLRIENEVKNGVTSLIISETLNLTKLKMGKVKRFERFIY